MTVLASDQSDAMVVMLAGSFVLDGTVIISMIQPTMLLRSSRHGHRYVSKYCPDVRCYKLPRDVIEIHLSWMCLSVVHQSFIFYSDRCCLDCICQEVIYNPGRTDGKVLISSRPIVMSYRYSASQRQGLLSGNRRTNDLNLFDSLGDLNNVS